MNHRNLLPLVALLPLIALAREARSAPALQEPISASVDRNRLYFDSDADGTLWARGRTWKASFSQGGATYIPFLGSGATCNHPVAFRVESVTIAGEPVAFDRDVPAQRDGDAIEYDRGAFRERYLFTPDSVEQTFEFDSLPRRGELVVSMTVASDLEAASDADGFRFENELGHVRYGNAFARHEQAANAPIQSRLSGNRIELVAPAAIVERAVGRFVIDPVLTTWAVQDTPADQFSADTAWDETNAVWLTVFEEIFSASDHDIRVVRHNSIGWISANEYVDTTASDWRTPAVANNNVDDQFLVVGARGAIGSRKIFGRTVGATDSLLMSAQFQISGNPFHDVYAPDVGGDSFPFGPTYYCVVWEREFNAGVDYDIHARLARTDATLVGVEEFIFAPAVSIHRNPAISNLNGDDSDVSRDWNIVWEDTVTPTNHDIKGTRVRSDGSSAEPIFNVATSALDERNPAATSIVYYTGGVRPWMVAYQIQTGANGWDVRCRTLDGTTLLTTFDLSEQFTSVALDQVTPSCDTGGGQFVVAWDEHPSGIATTSDIKVATLYTVAGSLGLSEGNFSASPGLELDSRPRIATRGAPPGPNSDAMVVFDRDDSGPNDVFATAYDIPNGGPVSVFCAGDGSGTACPCGNNGAAGHGCASSVNPSGAEMYALGIARTSSDSLLLAITGLPATTTALLFQGSGQSASGAGTPFGDGLRCATGTIVRLGAKTASGGSVFWPEVGEPDLSLEGGVPAIGGLRYYQGWYRNSASFCTASTFNLTNGMRVQWIH